MNSFRTWLELNYIEWQKNEGGRKTVKEYAEYLGTTQSTLSSWLNETRKPQEENIRKIADKLGLEVYDVLGLERPDPILHLINKYWDDLPPDIQEAITRKVEGYISANESKDPTNSKTKPKHI